MAQEKPVVVEASFLGGLGFPLAAALSYCKWGGFWLAFGHGILGYLYVFYYLLKYGIPHISR
jgi:hypothetical protein